MAAPEKIQRLKAKYEDVRSGLDHLQEEVLRRGIEMRPGLRRQFDEALRGLFYTMACADGRIDATEVRFYNYLFEEELSVETFELVMAQLERSHNFFEEDFLAAVGAFALYDRSVTGSLPLGAPSLSTLLISAAETVAQMVMESDGEIAKGEIETLRRLLTDGRTRAAMVLSDAEDLRGGEGKRGWDPDAQMGRDIRGVQREVLATLTEAMLQAADVIKASGIGMHEEATSSQAEATRFVIDAIRDDLERGRAPGELMVLGASQVRPMIRALRVVEEAGDAVSSSWRSMASSAREHAGARIRGAQASSEVRVRMLKEKHDWADEVEALEVALGETWDQIM